MKDILRQFTFIFTAILTITINALANILPINGLNTGEISDRFKVFFVPAGYVFSIWGLIYIGIIAFTVYQALPSQRQSPAMRAVGWWFSLGGLANSAWILAWHNLHFTTTVVLMLVLLISLLACYILLQPYRATASTAEKWSVHIPMSVYLGWISVATIANVTDWLDSIGWNRFGIPDIAWMGIMLLVVAALVGTMNFMKKDIAYTMVILWALAGIAVKHNATPFVLWATIFVFVWVAVSLFWAVRTPARMKSGAA